MLNYDIIYNAIIAVSNKLNNIKLKFAHFQTDQVYIIT